MNRMFSSKDSFVDPNGLSLDLSGKKSIQYDGIVSCIISVMAYLL